MVIAVIIKPPPTAKVPSGTASRVLSMRFPARSFTRDLILASVGLHIETGDAPGCPERRSVLGTLRSEGSPRGGHPGRGLEPGVRDDGGVKTRNLLILAFATGLIIVVAGVIQIFMLQ